MLHLLRLTLLGLFAVLLSPVLAVWDDEAFVVDWHIPQLGPLDTVLIHFDQESSTEFVTVLSKTNVLASVVDGEFVWRVQLDGHSALVKVSAHRAATVTNYKDGRGELNIWDMRTGFLLSEASFDKQIVDIEPNSGASEVAIILADGSLVKVNKALDKNFIGKLPPFDEVKVHFLGNDNVVILYKEEGTNAASYAFFDGTELKTHRLSIGYDAIVEFVGSKIITHTNKYQAISIDKKTGVASSPVTLINGDKHLPVATEDLVAFEYKRNIEVFDLHGKKQFTIPNVFKYDIQFVNGTFVMYTEYHVNIIDPEDGTEIVSYFLGDEKMPYDNIDRIIPSTNGIDTISSIIEFSDDTYALLHNTVYKWKRDYSLTDIVAQTVVHLEEDVTVVEEGIRHEEELDLLQAYLFRLTRHFEQLKSLYASLVESWPLLLKGQFPFVSTPRDEYFGFVKYLVLATRNGQIVALNTLTGQRAWTFNTGGNCIIALENVDSLIYAFTESGPRFFLDPKTGIEVEKQLLQPSNQIINLHKNKDSFLMETENLDLILSKETEDAYFVKTDEKFIAGYRVHEKDPKKTWSFDVAEDEVILGYSARDLEEKTANVGVVLGDRSVLYKYLYPNVAAFGVLNKKTGILTVNVIDTFTGSILTTQSHKNVFEADFKSVVGEHWIVYTYYSTTPTPEQKIVVIDLFESLVPNTRYSPSNSSSYTHDLPSISTQSFILPYRVKSMALTKTRFGVTTKAILVAFENNQIAYIPKPVLNSRRVVGRDLTADEKAEFLMMPYEPLIKLDDSLVLSHARSVMGADHIVSFPTNLESTTIVCTYGLDVFCTRLSPSSQFDKLTSGFDKLKMSASLVLLIVIVAVLKPIRASKELEKLWVMQPSR